MKKLIPALLILLLFFSCGPLPTIRYMGSSYATTPGKNIDVYVDISAVKRPYTIMGKGYVGSDLLNPERIQYYSIEQARKHGADAVLFIDLIYVTDQTGIRTTNSFDTSGLKTRSSGIIAPVVRRDREIQFLKYD